MPSYIERRRRLWYAVLDIPEDVRAHFPSETTGKPRQRFVKSTKTDSRATAARLAMPLVAGWKMQIERARKASAKGGPAVDPLEQEALSWREGLLDAKDDEERDFILSTIRDILESRAERGASMDDQLSDMPGYPDLVRSYDIVTGKRINLVEHLEEYLGASSTELTDKTKSMARSDVHRLAKKFPLLSDVNRKAVQQWVNKLMADDGEKLTPKTVQRVTSACRGYWRYLQHTEVVSEDLDPFANLGIGHTLNGKRRRPSPATARRELDPADVVKLLIAASANNDHQLADLIALAMWTGCRIEELCSLKVDKVAGDHIEIEDAKTAAGWRQVPIHSKLQQTMARLVEDSKDGYVMSRLTENKYGDRSNAIGKRFGRLKKAEGFDRRHVFHSIRKTVVTQLDNADVPVDLIAELVGHERPSFTISKYSGGAVLDRKQAAIEKLTYPE